MGMMSHVTNFRMRSVPLRSSERTNENRRASEASWLAYDSAPMRSARVPPCPAVTKLPQHLVAGALASGGFAGQQRLVDLEGVGLERAIGGDLGPLPQLHDVVVDHILQGYLPARRCGPR